MVSWLELLAGFTPENSVNELTGGTRRTRGARGGKSQSDAARRRCAAGHLQAQRQAVASGAGSGGWKNREGYQALTEPRKGRQDPGRIRMRCLCVAPAQRGAAGEDH